MIELTAKQLKFYADAIRMETSEDDPLYRHFIDVWNDLDEDETVIVHVDIQRNED